MPALRPHDASLTPKGWAIRLPSQGDTLLGDEEGIRSAAQKDGFSFIALDQTFFAQNLLDTPLKTPSSYPPSPDKGAIAAGHQVYNGERPTFVNLAAFDLFYDLSRLGIPNGQLYASIVRTDATWDPYIPTGIAGAVSYYQTAFDRKIEFETGVIDENNRFIGSVIGGTLATTFGPSAAIHVLLGLTLLPAPAVNVKYNATNRLYNKLGVSRSAVVDGPTGNPFYDTMHISPMGLNGDRPDQRLLVVDEAGYRNEASPGEMQTWLRAGGIYNTSDFRDYSRLFAGPTATVTGSGGVYALADRQLIQTAPDSPESAFRGIYAGASFEYAPPRTVPVSQYYEGRIYSLGPFDSRPRDLVSFVYNHQVFSHDVADQLNPASAAAAAVGVSVPMARRSSNAYTLSYLAHLRPGVFLSTGLSYTDHPSALYFRGEGSALNVLTGLLTAF